MQGRSHRTRDETPAERTRSPSARVGSRAVVDPFLQLQASAGNAAVTGLIRGDLRAGVTVQRLWDDDENVTGEGEAPAPEEAPEGGQAGETGEQAPTGQTGPTGESGEGGGAGEGGQAADPFAAVESEVTGILDPASVMDTLAPLATPDGQVGDFETPSGVTAQAMWMQRDTPPAEPEPTREGKPGDLIKAFKPFLEPALKFLEDNVLAALRKIKAGEAVVTIVVTAPIIIGPLTQPGPRKLALDQLDGTDITFGVIPNLQLKPQISDGQLKGGTLTYDLAPALRKAGIPF